VVIDSRLNAVVDANLRGLAAFQGEATSRDLLRRAEISKARQVIITLDRDDSAILTTLTARQLCPSAHVVAAVREQANVSLMRQSGAHAVVTSSEAVGRMLGLSAVSPNVGEVFEDLLSTGKGLHLAQRHVTPEEVGVATAEVRGEPVIAVIRNGIMRRFYDPAVARFEAGDKLVVVQRADELIAERDD
jgi:voltage-gated potassium channel